MIGSVNAERKGRLSWSSLPIHYFAIDGGSGAHLLARLTGYDLRLQAVASPRHAQVLLIIGPITPKFASSVAALAQALVSPFCVLLVGTASQAFENTYVQLEKIFPQAKRLEATTPEALGDALFHSSLSTLPDSIQFPAYEPDTVQMPSKDAQELASELLPLSLGPVQPFTSGPLRLLLVCDGEQILTVETEVGYARRDLRHVLTQTQWISGLQVARTLDPLAPFAGQLLYVQALEQLQHWQPSSQMHALRMTVLAGERVQNTLWWLVRFLHLLGAARLVQQVADLARMFDTCLLQLWRQSPELWLAPQQEQFDILHKESLLQLSRFLERWSPFQKRLERDRLLALRLRGIGHLDATQLMSAGITGPVLLASQQRQGDAYSRLLIRLHLMLSDVQTSLDSLKALSSGSEHAAQWEVPAGEARVSVEGPRGVLGLHLVSTGEKQPQLVQWERPSAALLPLLPALLTNQKLVDAEVVLASLDLSMMEADG